MRPATQSFSEGLFAEMTVVAPPATESTRVTTATDVEQEAERWDGLS